MTVEEKKIQLVRASRRRQLVRVRIGGGNVVTGQVGYVGEREASIVDRRTLRPVRVLIAAVEAVEVER